MESLTPNLKVKDIKDTITFYQEILGFKIIMILPEKDPVWALMQNNNVTIMFQQKKSFEEEFPHLQTTIGGSLSFFIKTTNLDSFYNQIKDKVKTIKAPHITPYNMKEFAIEDCNGYLLVFAEDQT
jgi:uncharacterized glyoxalase superfamily protein PhnB